MLEHTVWKWNRPKTWFSLALRVFTCSRYSHVSIDYTNEQGERRVLEAVWPKVHDIPYEEWEQHAHRRVLPRQVDALYYSVNLSAALALVGKRYGLMDLVEIFLNVFRTFWFCFGRTWNQKDGGCENSIYCSELGTVLLGIQQQGVKLPGHFEFMGGMASGKEFETGPV